MRTLTGSLASSVPQRIGRAAFFAPEIERSLVNGVLPIGARYYVDHAHPEFSTPEVTTAAEAVRWVRAADEIQTRAIAKSLLAETAG